MPSYFSKFPLVQYPVRNGTDFKFVYARNIMRRISMNEDIKGSGSGAFIEYDVKDGERPEHIAERIYGDPSYHWLVLLSNEIIDPYHGWYRSGSVFEEYIQKKYGTTSVYFTKSDDTFYYSSGLVAGCTLKQGSKEVPIVEYFPALCKLSVRGDVFSVGGATLGLTTGDVSVYIHKTEPSYLAVHHFEVSRPEGDCGANEEMVVDPLSQQNTSYSVVGGIIGHTEDEYPSTPSVGVDYVGSGTVDLHETYIGKYMGISGDEVTTYSVSNHLYENKSNDSLRKIKLLHPRYKKLAVEELDSLLRV